MAEEHNWRMTNVVPDELEERSTTSRSVARAYEFGHFVRKNPGQGVFLDEDYDFVKIHKNEEMLPKFIENAVEKGKITFRVNRDIEFLGVELQGFENDEIPAEWKDPLSFSGQFEVLVAEGTQSGYLVEDSNSEVTMKQPKDGSYPNKQVTMPVPLSVPLQADTWYTLEFEIKAPQLRFGKSITAKSRMFDWPGGVAWFEFKDGSNTGILAGIIFRSMALFGPLDRCHYAASRYDSVGFRRLEREDNGVVMFKVSRAIDLTGVRFFGMRSENYELDGENSVAIHSAGFEIHDDTNNKKIVKTLYGVFESTARNFQFGFPTSGHGSVRLEADIVYSLKFMIRGPKLRYGLNPRSTVAVRDDCNCCLNCDCERPPVTFTFLEETHSAQLEAIVFTFVNDDE